MSVFRSILLFALAALAEIGGAWLVWQGVREHRGGASCTHRAARRPDERTGPNGGKHRARPAATA